MAEDARIWREMADTLAAELRNWGWGDFHYSSQHEQEPRVAAILKNYSDLAAQYDGSDG